MSAHYIVRNYGKGGLRLVQQMIADAMLTLMGIKPSNLDTGNAVYRSP